MAYNASGPFLGKRTRRQSPHNPDIPLTILYPPTNEFAELAASDWLLEPFPQFANIAPPLPLDCVTHLEPSPATTCESLNSFHRGGETFRSPPLTPKSREIPRASWECGRRQGGSRLPEVVESTDSVLADFCKMEKSSGGQGVLPTSQPEEESAVNPLFNPFSQSYPSQLWQNLPLPASQLAPAGAFENATRGAFQPTPAGAFGNATHCASHTVPAGAFADVTPGASQLDGYQQRSSSSVLTAADVLAGHFQGGSSGARYPRVPTPPAWVNSPPVHELPPVPCRSGAILVASDDASPARQAEAALRTLVAHQTAAATRSTDAAALWPGSYQPQSTDSQTSQLGARQQQTARQEQINRLFEEALGHSAPSAHAPTGYPSANPTGNPSAHPSGNPSGNRGAENRSVHPSVHPSADPTGYPTAYPSVQPSALPSANPKPNPSVNPAATLNALRGLAEAPREVLEQLLLELARVDNATGELLPRPSSPPRQIAQSNSLQEPIRLQSLSNPLLFSYRSDPELLQLADPNPSPFPPESVTGTARMPVLDFDTTRLQRRTSAPGRPFTGRSLVIPPDFVLEDSARYESPGAFSVVQSVAPSNDSPAATSAPHKAAAKGKADAAARGHAAAPKPPNPVLESLPQSLDPATRASPKRSSSGNLGEHSADVGGTGTWRNTKRPRDELQQLSHSSGGGSAAGSMSRTAHPLEGDGPKEKEANEATTENRNRRMAKLRAQRERPCGCTQDWPNDMQQLRALCNAQSRDLFSYQMRLDMMNRRDTQQDQQIQTLSARVDELQRALADAHARAALQEGDGAGDGAREREGRERWGFGRGF